MIVGGRPMDLYWWWLVGPSLLTSTLVEVLLLIVYNNGQYRMDCNHGVDYLLVGSVSTKSSSFLFLDCGEAASDKALLARLKVQS